jgi:hypothetical protein
MSAIAHSCKHVPAAEWPLAVAAVLLPPVAVAAVLPLK